MNEQEFKKLIKFKEDAICPGNISLNDCMKLNPIKNQDACPKCFGKAFGCIPVKVN